MYFGEITTRFKKVSEDPMSYPLSLLFPKLIVTRKKPAKFKSAINTIMPYIFDGN